MKVLVRVDEQVVDAARFSAATGDENAPSAVTSAVPAASGATESPDAATLATGAAVVAAAIGTTVWVTTAAGADEEPAPNAPGLPLPVSVPFSTEAPPDGAAIPPVPVPHGR